MDLSIQSIIQIDRLDWWFLLYDQLAEKKVKKKGDEKRKKKRKRKRENYNHK